MIISRKSRLRFLKKNLTMITLSLIQTMLNQRIQIKSNKIHRDKYASIM